MKQIRLPTFLENLYRDLRDRRLLFPAIGLVIALLAVPIVLKSNSSTDRAPAVPRDGAAVRAAQAIPAVVTQQLGVTNYRKRLSQLESKNPFHKLYTDTPEPSSSAPLQSTSTSSTSSTGDTAPSSSATSPIGSLPPESGSTSSGGTSAVSTPPSSGGSDSATSHRVKPKPRYYAWRVAVKVGEPGHLKERSEVQRLAMLPSEGKPAATFLGATEDGGKALFLVSSDVDSVKGDGRCLPSHSTCQYLVMKIGDKANLHYAPDGNRYNIVLVDIHAVEVTDKLPKKPSGKAQQQHKLPLLGAG